MQPEALPSPSRIPTNQIKDIMGTTETVVVISISVFNQDIQQDKSSNIIWLYFVVFWKYIEPNGTS